MAVATKVERVWVDIETSGLDEALDPIFEIGFILTDKFGHEEIDKAVWYVGSTEEPWVTGLQRLLKEPFVRAMHQRSGLLEEWQQAIYHDVKSRWRPCNVEAEILNWLDGHNVPTGKMPLCGSSVDFDRARIKRWMPILGNNFHHRVIDISTLKTLCQDLNPTVYSHLNDVWKKDEVHRPLEDIRDSIAEYQFYMDNFLHVYLPE